MTNNLNGNSTNSTNWHFNNYDSSSNIITNLVLLRPMTQDELENCGGYIP